VRKIVAGVSLGVGTAAIVFLVGWAGWLEFFELNLYDARVRLRARHTSVRQDIVLVEINDATIRDFSPIARWPWPRALHAVLIDFLKRGGARVIAYDVIMSEASIGSFPFGDQTMTGEQSDEALARSVKQAGNVVFLGDAVFAGATEGNAQAVAPAEWRDPGYRLGPAIEQRPLLLPPFQSLTDATAGLGHNFLALDPDGVARRMAPFVRIGDKYVPARGVAAALRAGGFAPGEVTLDGPGIRIRDRRIPLVPTRVPPSPGDPHGHDQLTMLIDYRAPVFVDGKRPFPSYEARHLLMSEDLLNSGEKPLVDPAVFKDKIVFVGTTTSGLVDVFQTPFGASLMPGIQLHASIADSVLSNHFVHPAARGWLVGSTLVMAVIVGLMSALLPFAAATVGAALVVALWSWVAIAQLDRGVWLDMASPISASAIALFAGTAYRYFVEDFEKRKVKKLFGRYVSKDVYEQLLAHPDRAELGGKRREMSVLFSDIRGFTTVTEKGNPEELVAQLNEYFSRMVEVVFRHTGTVDKFVGDMVMALFGAPVEDPDHAEHAVQAAVDMVHELGELNRSWAERGMAQLDIGVGVNSGDMIAGNIGSSSIMSYTVIGDNVNLGSRLESLNKDYKTRIIISDATRVRLKGAFELRSLGDVVVKGKTRPVAIYEVRVPASIQEQKQS